MINLVHAISHDDAETFRKIYLDPIKAKIAQDVCKFMSKYIKPQIKNTLIKRNVPNDYWLQQQDTPSWRTWAGYAFETICYCHLNQIIKALDLRSMVVYIGNIKMLVIG